MELIYLWIEKFRSFTEVAVPLSGRFAVDYDPILGEIRIQERKEYYHPYPKHVTNIHALLGKNATGKSNLMELLALCHRDEDVNCFFLYHIRNGETGSIFFFEATRPEGCKLPIAFSVNDMNLHFYTNNAIYSRVCLLENNRLVCYRGISQIDERKNLPSEFPALLLFLPQSHMRRIGNEPMGYFYAEYGESIPSRDSIILDHPPASMLVSFLGNQLKRKDRKTFRDERYLLTIRYQNRNTGYVFKSRILSPKRINNERLYEELSMLHAFCGHFLFRTNAYVDDGMEAAMDDALKTAMESVGIPHITDEAEWKRYFQQVIREIAVIRLRNGPEDYTSDKLESITVAYGNMIKAFDILLPGIAGHSFENGVLFIPITENCDIDRISDFLKATVDENTRFEKDYVFKDFFNFELAHLSDGEFAFLNLMAVIDKAISERTQWKQFILLLDEPEEGMHPDLSRSLVNTLINFLSQYRKKKFQLIFSSHSPFIASDLLASNIIRLGNADGHSEVMKSSEQTFGQNIHVLLKDSFFMASTMGEYVQGKIREVQALLDREQRAQQRETETSSPEKTRSRQQQKSWQAKWQDAARFIPFIGEEVVRNTLKKRHLSLEKNEEKNSSAILNEYRALSAEEKAAFIDAILSEED